MSVWMFNNAGRPDKTQYYSRWLLRHKYTTDAAGIPGNDDYGTMSAWYVFAALGFYPRAGSSQYFVGSPLFEKVSLLRTNNCRLTIVAKNYSEHNVFVHSWSINGKVQPSYFLEHKDIECSEGVNEIVMEFNMSNTPLIKE